MPRITSLEQHWDDKRRGRAGARPAKYEDIHMPRNTAAGVVISAFGTVLCFALVWHIWWLAVVALVGVVAAFLARSYDRDVDYWVPAGEVERIENARRAVPAEVA